MAEQHKSDILEDILLEARRAAMKKRIAELERKPERISEMEARIQRINTETRAKINAGDKEALNQWRRNWETIALPEQIASALQQLQSRLEELAEEINQAKADYATLPRVREEFARLPSPRLLTPPEKQIYPGHPDHPETDSEDI